MVILKENHQIIEHSMEENVIIRRKGGGSIIELKPLFSSDGKYVYLLCGWCIRAYSTLTGECIRQFEPQDVKENDKLVSLAVEDCFVFSLSAKGYFTKWRYNASIPISKIRIKIKKGNSAVDIVLLKHVTEQNEYDCCVVEKEPEKEVRHVLLYSSKTGQLLNSLYLSADNIPHSVAFGKAGSDHYVAAIKHNRVTVSYVNGKVKNFSFLAGSGRTWTAVGCHPEECIVAIGDNTGRIVVWRQPMGTRDHGPKAVFHWHTLPVAHIAFSASGSYMYSGGGEGVMVKWNVESPNIRNFLPRLPAPVEHLSVSPDNHIIAISTTDNGVQLVDAQNRVFCVIQNLTWEVNTKKSGELFPVGLAWDPLTKCLVLNGRPGHLQFYNPEYNKLLYNLDITGQNIISQERNKEIINTDITHAKLSGDGKWMVTTETRNDKETSIEVWLKFWQYKFNTRQFSLNTCVELPHYGPVNCVRFQPQITPQNDSDINEYLLVTTGNDKKFRVWSTTETDSIYKDGVRWRCDSIGFYRDRLVGCVGFSSDGSLLGVIFGPTLTIWDVETNQMKTTLTRDNNDLRFVEFGKKDCSHLVITTNSSHLHVWNILTLTVLWTVPLQVNILISDMRSPYMAIFTKSNKLFVFTPSSSNPVFEQKEVSSSGVQPLSAIFVPRNQSLHQCRTPWLEHSQLHYIDSNQELLFVDVEGEGVDERHVANVMESDAPATPFSILVAKETTSTVQKVDNTNRHTQFGVLGGEVVRQLLSAPAHTMPHISSLCNAFLRSLVITKQSQEITGRNQEPETSGATRTKEDTSSDDEIPPAIIIHKQPSPDKKKKRKRTRKLSNTSKSSSRNSFSFDDNSIWPLSDVFTEK